MGSLSSVMPTLGSLSYIIGTGNNNGVNSSSGSNTTRRERSSTQDTSREDDIELRDDVSNSCTRRSGGLDVGTEQQVEGTEPNTGRDIFNSVVPSSTSSSFSR